MVALAAIPRGSTATQVRVMRVQSNLVGGDKFQRLGDGDEFEIVRAGVLAKPPRDREQSRHARNSQGDDEDVDWLGLARPRKEGMRRGREPSSHDHDRSIDHGDWLADALAEEIGDMDAQLAHMGLCEGEMEESESSDEDMDDGVGATPAMSMPPVAAPMAPSSPPPLAPPATPPRDLKDLRAHCMSDFKHTHIAVEIAEVLGFSIKPSWAIVRNEDTFEVGRIRVTFQGRTMHAECKLHSRGQVKCKLLLQIANDFGRAEAWLVKWLIGGSETTHEKHIEMASRLKDEVKVARASPPAAAASSSSAAAS